MAVQAYGGPNNKLTQTLVKRGATVQEISLYTWGLPEDVSPVLGLIDALAEGKVDALAFTSQIQIGNLLSIANQAGKGESLKSILSKGPGVVASVGPVCTERMLEAGFRVDVEPDHPHMGNLILALAERLNPN